MSPLALASRSWYKFYASVLESGTVRVFEVPMVVQRGQADHQVNHGCEGGKYMEGKGAGTAPRASRGERASLPAHAVISLTGTFFVLVMQPYAQSTAVLPFPFQLAHARHLGLHLLLDRRPPAVGLAVLAW